MTTLTIKLAGREFTISKLTLRQLRDLSVGVVTPIADDPQVDAGRNFDRAVAVISSGLIAKYPDMTPEALYQMPIERDEMNHAYDEILYFSGLVRREPTKSPKSAEESLPGEAQTGA